MVRRWSHLCLFLGAGLLLALTGPGATLPGSLPAATPSEPIAAADTTPEADDHLSAIRGRVIGAGEAEEPVPAATVTLLLASENLRGPGMTRTTSDQGGFEFSGLPSGTYLLETHHLGSGSRTDTLQVPVSRVLYVEVPLSPAPVPLEPLVVEVRRDWLADRGFFHRKSRGFGHFITPEQLDERSTHRLSEVLRTVPGVRVRCRGYPCDSYVRMAQSDARACRVEYYMDGDPMSHPVFPDDIALADVAAVEVYRSVSETPPEFYGRCGSVVIWTKRGR